MLTPLLLLSGAVLLYLFGYFTLLHRIEPFRYFFFVTSWWSYIIALDACLALKGKGFSTVNRRVFLLAVLSCGFWCIFELINIRLQNWSYICLPSSAMLRYTGYFLAFGTVIPALHLTSRSILLFLGNMTIKPFRVNRYPMYAFALGVLMLLLVLACPRFFFALTWVFLLLIVDAFNYSLGFNSFMKDLERGFADRLVSSILAGLICGILWEMWNFRAVSKWLYSVPFFSGWKVFEMPLPGYLGFPVFGLETTAFFSLLEGLRKNKVAVYRLLVIAAVIISGISFPLIDRYTAKW